MILENENYLKKLLTGKIPLVTTFWLWFIFISLCTEIVLQYILQNQIQDIYFGFTIYSLILIYSVFIFYIIFKSAQNYQGLKLWSFLAKTIVTLNLFFSLTFLIETYKYHFFEDYFIQKDINEFKSNLPIQVDLNSVLIDIYKKDKIIFYKYTLFGVDINDEKSKNIFIKQVQDSLCQSESTLDLLKKDYILSYEYTNENDEKLLNIETKKEDCGENIYDLEIISNLLKKQGV